MMSLPKFLFSICFLFFSALGYTQTKNIDSLWNIFNNNSNADTNRLKAIHEISWSYLDSDPDSAIILAQQALKLATDKKNKKHIGIAYFTLGNANLNRGDFNRAIENYKNRLTICAEIKDKKGIGDTYLNIGSAYARQLDFPKALEYYFKSIKTHEEIGNRTGIGNCYSKIARVYQNQADYSSSLDYYLKTLKLFQEIGNKKELGKAYNHIGQLYMEQFDHYNALAYFLKFLKNSEENSYKMDIGSAFTNIGIVYYEQMNYVKALEYQFKAMNIYLELNDKQNLGYCYINIGNAYDDQLNLKKALEYYLLAQKILEEIGDKYGISASCNNISIIYSKQKDYPKALDYNLKALRINKETGDYNRVGANYNNLSVIYNNLSNYKMSIIYSDSALKLSKEIGDIDNERLAYANLSLSYEKTGQYKEAYNNHVKFKKLTDSIFNVESSKQLGDLKTQFEVDKKATELKIKAEAEKEKIAAVTKEEKKTKNIIIGSVVFGLVLAFVFAVIIFRRLQITRKQKTIIEEQKGLVEIKIKETEIQKHIIEEKHKEITDSINYAERIQRSFIATKEILDENLNDYFVLFKPKDVVSGDFYWASKLNNGNFAFVTADSTGHGVPGAIMSLLNITSLEKAIETFTQPAEILNSTRKTIIERLKKDGSEHGGKDGMDASLTVYDFKNKKLIIAAANNPVWIVRGSETIEIKPDKMPVGKHDRDTVSFTQQEIDLQSGDVIYTLTDGFPDQFGGEKGKKYMSKNLRELLSLNAQLPMSEQKQLLEKTFAEWVGNLEQVDDVTLIGVRV